MCLLSLLFYYIGIVFNTRVYPIFFTSLLVSDIVFDTQDCATSFPSLFLYRWVLFSIPMLGGS